MILPSLPQIAQHDDINWTGQTDKGKKKLQVQKRDTGRA
jgi:hypothetical protein